LAEKLCEEGAELAKSRTKKQVMWEAADVAYFLLVKLAERGRTSWTSWNAEAENNKRANRPE